MLSFLEQGSKPRKMAIDFSFIEFIIYGDGDVFQFLLLLIFCPIESINLKLPSYRLLYQREDIIMITYHDVESHLSNEKFFVIQKCSVFRK